MDSDRDSGKPGLVARADEARRLARSEPEAAERQARAVLAEAREAGDSAALLRAHYTLGAIAVMDARYEEAVGLVAEGSAELAALGVGSSPELLNVQGTAYRYLGMYGLATERLLQAERLVRESDKPELVHPVLNNFALALSEIGEKEKAYGLFVEAEAAARAAGNDYVVLLTRSNIGSALTNLGRLDEALALLEATVESSRAAGLDSVLADALDNLGQARTASGSLREAETDFRSALAIERRLGQAAVASLTREHLAENLLLQGRFAEAEAEARGAYEAARRADHASLRASSVLARAKALEALGRFREAAEAYRERVELDAADARAEGRAAYRELSARLAREAEALG